jgi:UDP-2,3-diacylglucosamine hydrolase
VRPTRDPATWSAQAQSPASTVLASPPHWRRIALISDLHLSAQTPRTLQTFVDWLQRSALEAHALFILGDLFEAWIGDDLLTPPALGVAPQEARCAQHVAAALRAYTTTGRALFVQHGNRDFLLGTGFARATGAEILPDPVLLEFHGQRILLTHGDQLCLADTAYQRFRAQVRAPQWQSRTLAQPLAARVLQAQALRAASSAAQSRAENWADADADAASRWMAQTGAHWMIHGHTHRPCDHWSRGQLRQVLCDWDCDSPTLPRAQALWLEADGAALAARRAAVC